MVFAFGCWIEVCQGGGVIRVVLAVDGFHDGVDPKDVLYVGMSRARDKLIVVARKEEMDLIHQIQNSEK